MEVRFFELRIATAVVISVLLMAQVSFAGSRQQRSSPDPDQAELVDRQIELRNHWICRVPKPKLVYLLDEHPSLEASDTEWTPPAAVLHRCEPSLGCCEKPAKCLPEVVETVSVLFRRSSPPMYQRLDFQNHTRCRCIS